MHHTHAQMHDMRIPHRSAVELTGGLTATALPPLSAPAVDSTVRMCVDVRDCMCDARASLSLVLRMRLRHPRAFLLPCAAGAAVMSARTSAAARAPASSMSEQHDSWSLASSRVRAGAKHDSHDCAKVPVIMLRLLTALCICAFLAPVATAGFVLLHACFDSGCAARGSALEPRCIFGIGRTLAEDFWLKERGLTSPMYTLRS